MPSCNEIDLVMVSFGDFCGDRVSLVGIVTAFGLLSNFLGKKLTKGTDSNEFWSFLSAPYLLS